MQPKWTLVAACIMLILSSNILHALRDDDWDDLEDLDAEDSLPSGNAAATHLSRNLLMVLTDQNAQRVINSHEHVMLLGYAPWCARSSALMPEFAKAASTLAGSVLFAKLDAVTNTKAAGLYNIKGFPTVLLLTNGTSQMYPGGDTEEEIVNWIRKKTGSPASIVDLVEDAQALLRNNSVLVGGFFSELKGSEYESFIQAAKMEVGTHFIQTTNPEVARVFSDQLQKPPKIWVKKQEPEYFTGFDGTFTTDEVLNFVELYKLPLVVPMTSKNTAKISSSPLKTQIMLFCDKENIEDITGIYVDVARHFKGQMLFLRLDYSDEDITMPLLSLYGLEPGKPIIAAFEYENGSKYLLQKGINLENLMSFCTGIISKEAPVFYKSDPVPVENKGHLQIVVGNNFEKVIYDNTKDVFLQVTTPWCSSCEAANKTFEKLAAVFKDVPSVVIAQFDASGNEHPRLQVDNYPTFLFYPAGNKGNPIVASSKMKLRSLVHFVKKNAATAFDMHSEEVSPEKTTRDEL